jgi:hypothetical protein
VHNSLKNSIIVLNTCKTQTTVIVALGVEGIVVLLLEQLFDATTLALGVEGATMLFPK